MNKNYYCIIMAGGIGARFWPMSRTNQPKQFIDILETGETLIQQTFNRFRRVCPTENIFIEGENLEVLKVLQKSYFGKIKMIYIDPPYNTGNDNFIYPDRFSETKEEYLGRIGDKDEAGYMTREGLFRKNSKDSGHYHSNWLSMMYPRLFLARNLLKDDGVIFVSIDDNEVHNLRLVEVLPIVKTKNKVF